jgi:hypothetical protein
MLHTLLPLIIQTIGRFALEGHLVPKHDALLFQVFQVSSPQNPLK